MEQHAHQFYHEYQESHPDEWAFDHITQPRPSCAALLKTRQYAEPPELTPLMEQRFYKAGERHDAIPHVYCNNAGNWFGKYVRHRKAYHTPTKPTPRAAGLAYNAVIRERGLPERYLIDWDNLDGIDDMEDKSA